MPAHLIQQEWGKGLSVEEMAKLFLVSRKAMEIRINGMIKQGLLSERKP
jgi:predicted RNA polymerase sigma factor